MNISRLNKVSARIQDIPHVGQHGWQVPNDAILLRHVHLRNDSSPEKKEYVVRVVAVPVQMTSGSAITTNYFVVTIGYWGSSKRGFSWQVKRLEQFGSDQLPTTHFAAIDLQRKREADGYVTSATESHTLIENISASSVPLRGMRSVQAPNSPSMTPTFNTQPKKDMTKNTAPTQAPPEKTPAQRLAEKKAKRAALAAESTRNAITQIRQHHDGARGILDSILKVYKSEDTPDNPEIKDIKEAIFSNENLPLVREAFSTAIKNGFLIDFWKFPQDFFDMLQLDEEAKEIIREKTSDDTDIDFGSLKL